jgi:hypothetical protein
MAAVKRGFGGGLRGSGTKCQARPSFMIRRDHVAGWDQKPEQEEQRKYRRYQSAAAPDASGHSPHATQSNPIVDPANP